MNENIKKCIEEGRAVLGLELGSTRIKAVLIDEAHRQIAGGSFEWENDFRDGVWTYSLEDAVRGVQECYAALKRDVRERCGAEIRRLAALGVSAMMHGYLPFDRNGRQLCEFRTWRNTITGRSAKELTELFGFNIPQRWSVAHIDRAIIEGEPHVRDIAHVKTLAGYIHTLLGGENVVGVGEASGMFPIAADGSGYDARMARLFDERHAHLGLPWKILDILPKPVHAGECAGRLSAEGAKLLDPTGALEPGAPLAPPEGDAGTGMAATCAVAERTGNVSAGTSIFSMVVLERPLANVHEEIDMVTTPTGAPVAMVHCNNCTSDLDAWAGLFGEAARLFGAEPSRGELFDALYAAALEGEPDCGGVLTLGYLSGEPVTGFAEGRPLAARSPDSHLTLANFMRAQAYSAVATLATGMRILDGEGVKIDRITGHGGFFKAEGVGAQILADALRAPVTTMSTAGEGGPWGMALLAAYMLRREQNETLESYLARKVFAASDAKRYEPTEAGAAGYAKWLEGFKTLLAAEKTLIESEAEK